MSGKGELWRRHFDRIYCIHYLPQAHKLRRLEQELSRVGITQSGLLEWRYTVPSPYDAFLYERYKHPQLCPTKGYVNVALEYRAILWEALFYGYERILVMEDDLAFLKDLDLLKAVLDAMPMGYDLVQLDKFVLPIAKERWDYRLEHSRINEHFLDASGVNFTSAACLALTRTGMRSVLEVEDARLMATDMAFAVIDGLKYASSITNLAVQVLYGDACNLQNGDLDLMHRVYTDVGIDYADYAVPEGYGVGSVYTEKEVEGKAEKGA